MGLGNESTEPVYQVKSSEDLGRHLTAAKDLAPGDLVLSERPIVFGPKSMMDPEASVPCVGCYKPLEPEAAERCARCGWPVCSGNCPGLKDPRNHGLECEILSVRPECVLDDMPEYYRHDALLPLRCVLLQKTDPDSWSTLLEMQSHMDSRTPGSVAYEEANEFVVEYLMNNFISALDGDLKSKYLPEISSELLHRMCGIIDTNALEIRLADGAELFALYPKTYLVEHSCLPNTKHTFNLTSNKDKNELYTITMKAVVPIQKDHHISTMYSHALWGTPARRQHLKDTKFFSCKCIRCSDPTELGTYISAAKCLGQDGSPCEGIHLPEDPLDDDTDWACNRCPAKVNSHEINMVIFQMGEEVETIQLMGGSIQVLEKLLSKLSTFLHPNHYHLYTIKHSLVQLYGRQPGFTSEDILDKKIKMCKDLIGVTKILDPGNARLSLYSSVLQHELHSALVMKAIAKKDGESKPAEEMKLLLQEAKTAVDDALAALLDDTEETSGKKLFLVIEETKKCFENLCKENNLPL